MTGVQVGYGLAFETLDGTFMRIHFSMLDIHVSQTNKAVFMLTAKTNKSIRVIATSLTLNVLISTVRVFQSPLHC